MYCAIRVRGAAVLVAAYLLSGALVLSCAQVWGIHDLSGVDGSEANDSGSGTDAQVHRDSGVARDAGWAFDGARDGPASAPPPRDGGSSSGGSGGPPPPPVDSGPTSCDPVSQSNCGSAETCVYFTGGETGCVTSNGPETLGTPCSSDGDCTPGNVCYFERTGDSLGVCRPFCGTTTGSCQGAMLGQCDQAYSSIPNAGICEVQCNVNDPKACCGSSACAACTLAIPNNTGTALRSDCLPPGKGLDGQTCTSQLVCAAGFGCFVLSGQSVCLYFCQTSLDCNGSATCNPQHSTIGGYSFSLCY